MVQRRIAHKQIPRAFLSHFLRNPLPVQFLLPSGRQRLVHIQADQISVRRSPSPRLITERDKLNRQFPPARKRPAFREFPEKHPPPRAPPPAASPKSDFPCRTPARAHRKSQTNPHSPPAVANPSATTGPAPSQNPAPSANPAAMSRESTADPNGRDPQSPHPSIRQSRRCHPVAPAADAPATSSTPSRRRPEAKSRQTSCKKCALRVSFVLALNYEFQ